MLAQVDFCELETRHLVSYKSEADALFPWSATVSRSGTSRSKAAWVDAVEKSYTMQSADVAAAGLRDTAALRERAEDGGRMMAGCNN